MVATIPLTPRDTTPLQQRIAQAEPGDVLKLAAGHYRAKQLVSRVDLTLRGEDPKNTVIDLQQGQLLVEQESLILENLTLRGGRGEEGGGIAVVNDSHLELSRCILSGNSAEERGGGLAIGPGTAQVRRCIFSFNEAPGGGAVSVGERSEAIFYHTLFLDNTASEGGALWITANAHVLVKSCTFLRNRVSTGEAIGGSAVAMRATLGYRPEANLINCLLGDPRPLSNPPLHPGYLRLASSLVPPGTLDDLRYSNGYDNLEAEARFTELATWPLLALDSPGRGMADITEIDAEAQDFLGRPLVVLGDADPGALGLLRKEESP